MKQECANMQEYRKWVVRIKLKLNMWHTAPKGDTQVN